MRNRHYRLLLHVFGALIVLTSQSCTHYYYGPNSGNIPVLQQRADVRISAAAATASETSGFELQSSYAVTNHVGVMFNFYTARGKDQYTSSGPSGSTATVYEKGTGTYAEVGGGYFAFLDKSRNWIFETYAGAGTGTLLVL